MAELPERFALGVHAFLLMHDHYHLLHGDWGRDAVMYVAVRHGGLRLAELMGPVGMKCHAAAQAVKRFAQALARHSERKRFVTGLRSELSTIDSAEKPSSEFSGCGLGGGSGQAVQP